MTPLLAIDPGASGVKFFVSGNPKGQPRARVRFGGKGVFDPGTADGWKSCIRSDFKNLTFASKKPIFEEPVSVVLTFFMPRPKAHIRSNGEVKPLAPVFHGGKPDSDNLAKAVLDALTNAGAWADDGLVSILTVAKLYGGQAGCQIDITLAHEGVAFEHRNARTLEVGK
jgi:Holliday junction resolvase RusA-like endonuclease